jgi:hypothetical protein
MPPQAIRQALELLLERGAAADLVRDKSALIVASMRE